MKVLVVEDKAMHRESAKETLAGHELTIVASFDEAMKLMGVKIDREKLGRLLTEAGFPAAPTQDDTQEKRSAYWQKSDELEEQCVVPFAFDVVLTDMMMPMSQKMLAPDFYKWGEQVPYGFIIALKAALCGAKFVALVTDTNHHLGAMSAAIDHLGSAAYYREGCKPNFIVNGAKVMLVHAPFIKDVLKDWGQVLKDLTQ